MPTQRKKVIVIGGGIAGASVAHELYNHDCDVIILEKEYSHDIHTSGRTAAANVLANKSLFERILAQASLDKLRDPSFSSKPILSPRGGLIIASDEQVASLSDTFHRVSDTLPGLEFRDRNETMALLQAKHLRKEYIGASIWEEFACDIDVTRLHDAYLQNFKQDENIFYGSDIKEIRQDNESWVIKTAEQGTFTADVVVNAAGAWSDEVAALAGIDPIGLINTSRSVVEFAVPSNINISKLAFVLGENDGYFFRFRNGRIIASPMDEDETHPHDVKIKEERIEETRQKIQPTLGFPLGKVTNSWAGIRSYAPGHEGENARPIVWFDQKKPPCLRVSSLKGTGIMVSAILGIIARQMITNNGEISEYLQRMGINKAALSPHSQLTL